MTYRELVGPASTRSTLKRVRRIGNDIRGARRASPDVNRHDQVDAFSDCGVCLWVCKPGEAR
jgi:hypothetical protein